MWGGVEGAVALFWRVRDPAELTMLKKQGQPSDAAYVLEPVSAPWKLGTE
jgi:hypothetical protein